MKKYLSDLDPQAREAVEFLRDNLKIKICISSPEYTSYPSGKSYDVDVSIHLGEDIIATDSDSFFVEDV